MPPSCSAYRINVSSNFWSRAEPSPNCPHPLDISTTADTMLSFFAIMVFFCGPSTPNGMTGSVRFSRGAQAS